MTLKISSDTVNPERDNPRLVELRTLLILTLKLIDDPQPGLGTWVEAYGNQMRKIVAFWQQTDTGDPDRRW